MQRAKIVPVEGHGVEREAFAQTVVRDRRVRDLLSGHRWRLLHVVPIEEWNERESRFECQACEAVFYDYTRDCTLRVEGGVRAAAQISERYEQPIPSDEEFAAAVALVAQSPVWGGLLQSGHVTPYQPMPPMLEPLSGQPVPRTLFVGLASKPRRFNRVVAVRMGTGEVSREPVTPPSSLAVEQTCGAPGAVCLRPSRGTSGSAILEWPATNPVWRMQVIRPTASSGANGSGVELRNVRYRGRSVLRQAHMPLLNVQYAQDVCGPYRDWLWQETCFEAIGSDIPGAPGFRWCTQPPRTMLESSQDGGNFVGVAVYETADGALGLVSQTAAGWYRYIMRWLFYPDGRIMPRLGFDGTANSCVCNTRSHHAYWRFNFDVVKPDNVLEERVDSEWQLIDRETTRLREPDLSPFWRVRHRKSRAGYEIVPGPTDDLGDEFSGPDLYALKQRKNQIDDGRSMVIGEAEADLVRFVNNERITGKDLVVWYAVHFRPVVVEDGGLDTQEHTEIGPTLVPFNWPGSTA